MRAEFLSWFCRPSNQVRVFRMFDCIAAANSSILPSTQLAMVPATALAPYATEPPHIPDDVDNEPAPEFQVDCALLMRDLALEMAVVKSQVLEDENTEVRFESVAELALALREATRWASHWVSVGPRYGSYHQLQHIPDTLLHSWELSDASFPYEDCDLDFGHVGLICSQCRARYELCVGSIPVCVVYVVPCDDDCGHCMNCLAASEESSPTLLVDESDDWLLPASDEF